MSRVRNRGIDIFQCFLIFIISLIFFLCFMSSLFACNKVIKVSDGDTFHIEVNGETNKYRVLGIDTFDRKAERVEKQIKRTGFTTLEVVLKSQEAKNFAKELLLDKCVDIRNDKVASKDPYGRKLAYIYINGEDYSKIILEKELAMVYCENKKIAKFQEYQQISKWKCK